MNERLGAEGTVKSRGGNLDFSFTGRVLASRKGKYTSYRIIIPKKLFDGSGLLLGAES